VSVSDLEESFNRSEDKRKRVEEKRQLKKIGVNSSELSLTKVEVAKAELKRFAKELAEMANNVLEVAHQQSLNEERRKLGEAVEQAVNLTQHTSDALEEVLTLIRTQTASMADLNRKFTDFFSKADAQRQLEKETLQKLNDYLDNWL
jgi:hypothetical protein